jgi:3-phenylpropionate/cinnamic acid dioxygenase small subunit
VGAAVDPAVHAAVSEVLVRYATGIDQRDWATFRTCFTPDVVADYGDIGVWHGVDEIAEWMEQTHALMGRTLHRITNVVVQPGADRNEALARSYVQVVLVFGADSSSGGVRADGTYDDRLVRTDDGWRIAQRSYTAVHTGPL